MQLDLCQTNIRRVKYEVYSFISRAIYRLHAAPNYRLQAVPADQEISMSDPQDLMLTLAHVELAPRARHHGLRRG
jgi:hypothetical protein